MSNTATWCLPIVEFVDKNIDKKPIYLLTKESATMILLINFQWKYSLQVHITITQNGMLVNLCVNDPYLPRISVGLTVQFVVIILCKTALDIGEVYKMHQMFDEIKNR